MSSAPRTTRTTSERVPVESAPPMATEPIRSLANPPSAAPLTAPDETLPPSSAPSLPPPPAAPLAPEDGRLEIGRSPELPLVAITPPASDATARAFADDIVMDEFGPFTGADTSGLDDTFPADGEASEVASEADEDGMEAGNDAPSSLSYSSTTNPFTEEEIADMQAFWA